MKVLFVLTSHSALGNSGEKTGFWIEEFAAPYYHLADAGVAITVVSPEGGQPPVDPKSETAESQSEATKRFYVDKELIDAVAHSHRLNEVKASDFDAVFYPGGHGPLWDLASNKDSIQLIEDFYNSDKPIAFVCHAPAALLHAKSKKGEFLVKGKHLTSFSNSEEDSIELTNVVPFLLEDELTKRGAHYSKGEDWGSYVKQDDLIITGQNPASSVAVAKLLLKAMNRKSKEHSIEKEVENEI